MSLVLELENKGKVRIEGLVGIVNVCANKANRVLRMGIVACRGSDVPLLFAVEDPLKIQRVWPVGCLGWGRR